MQRKATPVQKKMLKLMLGTLIFLVPWLIYEVQGIFNPAGEDTYSEWFFDLSWALLVPLSIMHLIPGVLLVWASIHFIEGKIRRWHT